MTTIEEGTLEYAAINSAIDELIPARYRGRVDIAVNGTYWAGALLASVLFLLVVKHLPGAYSWRIAFLFGPALGFVILFVYPKEWSFSGATAPTSTTR